MEDGAEITVDSVQQFVDGFRSDKLPKNKIVAVHKAPKNDNVTAWKNDLQTDSKMWMVSKCL